MSKRRRRSRKKQLRKFFSKGWMALSVLLIFIVVSIVGKMQWNAKYVESTPETVGAEQVEKLDKVIILPTHPAWSFPTGTWKETNVPGWGPQMQGVAGDKKASGSKSAEIMTDSPFASLKQRGIGGKVAIYDNDKLVIEKELPADGSTIDIPIYTNGTGWHRVRLVYAEAAEVNGLIIGAASQVQQVQ